MAVEQLPAQPDVTVRVVEHLAPRAWCAVLQLPVPLRNAEQIESCPGDEAAQITTFRNANQRLGFLSSRDEDAGWLVTGSA